MHMLWEQVFQKFLVSCKTNAETQHVEQVLRPAELNAETRAEIMVTEDDDNAMCLLLALVVNKIRFPIGFEIFSFMKTLGFARLPQKKKGSKIKSTFFRFDGVLLVENVVRSTISPKEKSPRKLLRLRIPHMLPPSASQTIFSRQTPVHLDTCYYRGLAAGALAP